MRLLVLTLASGEQGLEFLRQGLREQSFRADHHVIEGLGNLDAHRELYRVVMQERDRYDLFFKVDADMTLRHREALERMVRGTHRYPEVRHFLFPIYDFFTLQEIRGVSLYRSGVEWRTETDGLFVDPAPVAAKAVWCGGRDALFINHGEHVSDFESFSFGVHKAIKILQRDRTDKKLSKQSGRLLDLTRVRRLCAAPAARRRDWLVMRGVAWVLQSSEYQQMTSKAALQRMFETLSPSQVEALDRFARRLVFSSRTWLGALAREIGWIGTLRAATASPPAEKKREALFE